MSEPEASRPASQSPEVDALDEGGLHAPPELGVLGKLWWWFHFAILVKLARLRFLAILGAIGALIVYWDTLVAHYEKLTRPLRGAEQVASSDVEYFCPMHPQVVTNNPKEKCPICFMNLTRRKKGEAAPGEALPPGVVQRLQLTPYKVVASGIRTWEVGHEGLVKKVEAVGTVEFDERKLARITARATGKSRIDKLYVNVTGQTVQKGAPLADLYSPELVVAQDELLRALEAARGGAGDYGQTTLEAARTKLRLLGILPEQIAAVEKSRRRSTHLTIHSPIAGYVIRKYQVAGEYVEEGARLYDVADLSTVWIEAQVYEQDVGFLKLGQAVRATAEAVPNRAFEGKLAFLYPHLDQGSRTLRVRFDVPNPDHEKKPEASLKPGMFATVRIEVPAAELGPPFAARDGRVLAVPEDAVVYTGSQKVVFRQEGETTFDAVQVELGPLCVGPGGDTFYPVLKGLKEREKVVSVGSYLLDAETRVSAAAGSIYYGGGGASKSGSSGLAEVRPTTPEDQDMKVKANLGKLSTPDRLLAEAQKVCPIQRAPLGSMGPLVKVMLKGQPVFLCCKGCEDEAKENPDKTLAEAERLKKTRGTKPRETGVKPAPAAEAPAKVKAALAKLSEEDRRLAEAQKYCPIQQDKLLGSMGKPAKVMVKGQPVFLCCAACEDEAKESPEKTLALVEKLKAKAKADASGKGGRP
ncbi:MAG: efflux RND transporter periplasmic adaptor subunit [Gemmataceae bacterium]